MLQDSFIVDIDAIQAHGIGAVDIAKLKANGYYTIASVHSATRRNLLKIKGFSEIKVDKVKDAIVKCQVQHASWPSISRRHWPAVKPAGGGFQTAHELGQQRKRVLKISTGSKQLDTILGGWGYTSLTRVSDMC
jgi:meiotic recombination protein DMC1